MKNISLNLKEGLLEEAESILKNLKKSRNKYINEAIEFYNKYHRRKLLEKQLRMESKLVARESLEVLREFEALEDEL